jgi:DNA modification methylase
MSTNRHRKITVIYLPITALRLDPANARVHSAKQIRQIARSIHTFDFIVPILADAELGVIAGHGRLLAARHLGLTEVPVILLEHLSEAQKRAFMIADNRLTENAEWDERLLAEQLRDLSLLDLDFSLEVTGFEMGEIDLRIEGLTEGSEERDADDEVPPVGDRPAVTRTGDLWMCGSNKIVCGSALEPSSFSLLMDGAKANVIFTDPPYNVPIEGNVSGFGAVRHCDFVMASGEMSKEEFTKFLATVFTFLARYSVPASVHFLCMDWRHQSEMLTAGSSVYTELKNLCVWVKDSAGMGSLYRSAHELVFVFKNGKEPHRNNIQLGRFGRDRTNVWKYAGAAALRRSDEGNLLALAATPKPVAMVADAIMDVSARGDIVLDSFLGSGTTVIAAERTGRRCYGIEIDPLFVDTAIRRWEAWTRDHARHAASGMTFEEVAAERGAGNK